MLIVSQNKEKVLWFGRAFNALEYSEQVDHKGKKETVRHSEYIFDLSDKNVSDYVIYGKFTTSNMHIKGKWSVTFPLEKVR